MIVRNKLENQSLFKAGAFGNKLQSWDSVEEWQASGFQGEVVLRSRLVGSDRCVYHLSPRKALETVEGWEREGYARSNVYLNEQGPEDVARIFQGEVMRSDRYYDLLYSTVPLPMRQALSQESRHAFGLRAVLLLRQNLWPNSYSDLLELFDSYPDSVVEFTSYERAVGDCQYRNTVIWEVRNY